MPEPLAVPRKLTSGTPAPRQRGFSLVELLVALMVIVLITSMVSLSFNSGSQEVRLDAEVRNLAGVASYALDEAQMTGVDFGLLLEEEFQDGQVVYTYSWMERYLDGWGEPQSGKELFATQVLPEGIELELELEDAPLVSLSIEDDSEIVSPQVVFYASGETTVGAINLRRTADSELLWRIEWDLLGRFTLMPKGIEPEEEYE